MFYNKVSWKLIVEIAIIHEYLAEKTITEAFSSYKKILFMA